MSAQTPMKKLTRRGRRIYVTDSLDHERLVATAETTDDARWLFGPLSGFHGQVVEVEESDETEQATVVVFAGGPWDGQSHTVPRVIGPVFAVGDEIGNHYWLDSKSDPPTYHWDPDV